MLRISSRLASLAIALAFILTTTGCGANTIWQAAETGQYHEVERMLNDNPNWINAKDSAGRTPLMNAVHGEHEDVVKLLLERGADPRITGASGFNALHEARQANNSEITKMIERKIEELNKIEGKGKTGAWWEHDRGSTIPTWWCLRSHPAESIAQWDVFGRSQA